MTTTAVTLPSGGFADSVYYGTQDSAGYLESNDGTAPSAADVDGAIMLQIVGLQDFPFAAEDPQTPSQRGNKGALARFVYPAAELPGSALAMGNSNYDFEALLTSQSVATIGGGKFIGRQGGAPTFKDMLLLAVGDAKSKNPGNAGGMWEGRLIYYVNAYPKGRDTFNDSAVPTYPSTVVANPSTVFPWGIAHSVAMGDNSFPYVDFTWPYKPILQRFTGDNAVVSWNLGQNIAEDSADNIVAFSAGVELTWVTGVPGAGEFGVTEGATDLLVEGTATVASGKLVALFGWS